MDQSREDLDASKTVNLAPLPNTISYLSSSLSAPYKFMHKVLLFLIELTNRFLKYVVMVWMKSNLGAEGYPN